MAASSWTKYKGTKGCLKKHEEGGGGGRGGAIRLRTQKAILDAYKGRRAVSWAIFGALCTRISAYPLRTGRPAWVCNVFYLTFSVTNTSWCSCPPFLRGHSLSLYPLGLFILPIFPSTPSDILPLSYLFLLLLQAFSPLSYLFLLLLQAFSPLSYLFLLLLQAFSPFPIFSFYSFRHSPPFLSFPSTHSGILPPPFLSFYLLPLLYFSLFYSRIPNRCWTCYDESS